MKKYNVYFKEFLIGILYATQTQHKYDCLIDESMDTLTKEQILSFAKQSQDWGEKIHFFEAKISNANRFDNITNISSHGDNYVLVEIQA